MIQYLTETNADSKKKINNSENHIKIANFKSQILYLSIMNIPIFTSLNHKLDESLAAETNWSQMEDFVERNEPWDYFK